MKPSKTQIKPGLGTQLRRLLELLDGDLEAIYQEDIPGYLPRYTPIMKALLNAPKTIKEIAELAGVSHSAASQTISKMIQAGYLKSEAESDSRYRRISLTVQGEDLVPRLQRYWSAADRAAAGLDKNLDVPLSDLLQQSILMLEKKSFRSRIETSLKRSK